MVFRNVICAGMLFVLGMCGGIAVAQSKIRTITIEKNSTVRWIIPEDIARIQIKSTIPDGTVILDRTIAVVPGQIMYISTNQ